MPLVSVIIPVYNGELTITSTLQSVLNQSFVDFEIIIINDGSTDSTLNIVSEIQDSRLKTFSYSNAGLAISRNRGFSHAIGDFIAFLDADDLWLEDKLQAQVTALKAHPEAGVAYTWTDYIDEDDNFLYPGDRVFFNGKVYQELLLKNFLDSGSNPLIRREALTAVGEFDPSINSAADWDMWLRLASRYPFVLVPKSLVLYRQPLNSMSSNLKQQERECLMVIERIYQQSDPSLSHFKNKTLANLYQYLMFKSLQAYSKRKNSLAAARYYCLATINNPVLPIERSRLMIIVAIKILVGIFFPRNIANIILNSKKIKPKTIIVK